MTNTYLEGNFGPVREEVTVTELPVTGTLPDQLDGRYLRIGPNPVNDRVPATYHWFTGYGMVHGVRLREGRAEWYRNRYVRSRTSRRRSASRRGRDRHTRAWTSCEHECDRAGRTHVRDRRGRRPARTS